MKEKESERILNDKKIKAGSGPSKEEWEKLDTHQNWEQKQTRGLKFERDFLIWAEKGRDC